MYCTSVIYLGPLTIEAPIEICTGISSNTIIERGYCYTRIEERPKNLDIAYLTCKNYNGALYTFNDTSINMKIYSNFSMGEFIVQNPDEYDIFEPQNGYFNLLTSNLNFGIYTDCKLIREHGNLVNCSCNPETLVNYICESG